MRAMHEVTLGTYVHCGLKIDGCRPALMDTPIVKGRGCRCASCKEYKEATLNWIADL